MAQNKRIARVAELIRTEIADIILNELKDPRLGFITVMGVEVAPDLRDANVFISVMGSDREKKSTLIALDHSKGFLQYRINESIRLRYTPRLHFKLDESIDQSVKIDKIIKKINDEKQTTESDV